MVIVYPSWTDMWECWERFSALWHFKHRGITTMKVNINFNVEPISPISLAWNFLVYPFSFPFKEMHNLPAKPNQIVGKASPQPTTRL